MTVGRGAICLLILTGGRLLAIFYGVEKTGGQAVAVTKEIGARLSPLTIGTVSCVLRTSGRSTMEASKGSQATLSFVKITTVCRTTSSPSTGSETLVSTTISTLGQAVRESLRGSVIRDTVARGGGMAEISSVSKV